MIGGSVVGFYKIEVGDWMGVGERLVCVLEVIECVWGVCVMFEKIFFV